jgi:hypothetical protein
LTPERKKLKIKSEKVKETLAETLLGDQFDRDEAEKLSSWLEIKKKHFSEKRKIFTIFILMIGAFAFGLSYSLKTKAILCHLDLNLSQINLQTNNLEDIGFSTNSLQINSILKASVVGGENLPNENSDNELLVEGNSIQVRIFKSEKPNKRIGIQREREEVYMRFYTDTLRIQIDVSNGSITSLNSGEILNFEGEIPTTIELLVGSSNLTPIEVEFEDNGIFEYPEIFADEVGLTKGDKSGEPRSSIESGNLSLVEIQGELYLKRKSEFNFNAKQTGLGKHNK